MIIFGYNKLKALEEIRKATTGLPIQKKGFMETVFSKFPKKQLQASQAMLGSTNSSPLALDIRNLLSKKK
jgi:hypothetical protein